MPAAAALNSWTQHPKGGQQSLCDIPWKIITSYSIGGEGCVLSHPAEWLHRAVLAGAAGSPRPHWVPKKQLDAATNHSSGIAAVSQFCQLHWDAMGALIPPQRELPKGALWPTAAPAVGVLLQPISCQEKLQHMKPPGFSGRKLNPPPDIDNTTALPFSDPEI